ncbi:MAG: response regulator transcription factor [Bacteroidota bacterium]|nr:response regulator transcription factor [Bacteroidota bacterium]
MNKIILVEDKKTMRELFALSIQYVEESEIIFEAADGEEFLDALENPDIEMPDIVFMDIMMPNMDGITATKKALEKYPNLTIIGLSVYNHDNYIEKIMDAGAKGYLLKYHDNYDQLAELLNAETPSKYFSKEIPDKYKNS